MRTSFVGLAGFLLAVATVAALLPARRAGRVDPMVALPAEKRPRDLHWGVYRKENVAKRGTQRTATVGVAEHGNSAEVVTVAPGGELLDRRRMDLTDRGLPTHPHHYQGSWAVGRYLNTPGARALSLADAVALVERVRASTARGAREGLEALAAAVPMPIASIAIRVCPELPPTIEEPSADTRTTSEKASPDGGLVERLIVWRGERHDEDS